MSNGPSNIRINPFVGSGGAATYVNLTETHIIPSVSPFVIRLNEVPEKRDPSNMKCVYVDDTTGAVTTRALTEVAATPAAGQFRPDYSTKADKDDSCNTGLIEFNSADAGKIVQITYTGMGTLAAVQSNKYPSWYTDRGDGSDGDFIPSENTTIGGVKNYKRVFIKESITVTIDSQLVIKSTDNVIVAGSIVGAGGNGGRTGQGAESGVPGGSGRNGGIGGDGSGGGYGGAGGRGRYNEIGCAGGGNIALLRYAGNGGGGGLAGSSSKDYFGGGGGGGGYGVTIVAPEVTLTNTSKIKVNGGNGGNGDHAGAGGGDGGGGGDVYIIANSINNNGTITNNGGDGGEGGRNATAGARGQNGKTKNINLGVL